MKNHFLFFLGSTLALLFCAPVALYAADFPVGVAAQRT